jgi:hypothetical protein
MNVKDVPTCVSPCCVEAVGEGWSSSVAQAARRRVAMGNRDRVRMEFYLSNR